MSEETKIEWCDHTINLWWGCTKVSPGCANCYAAGISRRFGKDIWGPGRPREDHRASAIRLAWKLNRKAEKEGRRYRVFSASMGDWLDPDVPVEWLADLIDLIRRTPNLDWLLLTKRPQNWRGRMMDVEILDIVQRRRELVSFLAKWRISREVGEEDCVPRNVWIGTSVEDQQRADERIPALLEIPAKVRFLSCEPLLGPVTLPYIDFPEAWRIARNAPLESHHEMCSFRTEGGCLLCDCAVLGSRSGMEGIHWVIAGGESGPKARPMHPDWVRSLRDQCQAADVPFFFKQWGEWLPICEEPTGWESTSDGDDWHVGKRSTVIQLDGREEFGFPAGAMTCIKLGKKHAGRLLDGREHNEFPEGGAA